MGTNRDDRFWELFNKAINVKLADEHQLQAVNKSQEDLARDILSTKNICETENSSVEIFNMSEEDIAYANGLNQREEELKEKINQQNKE